MIIVALALAARALGPRTSSINCHLLLVRRLARWALANMSSFDDAPSALERLAAAATRSAAEGEARGAAPCGGALQNLRAAALLEAAALRSVCAAEAGGGAAAETASDGAVNGAACAAAGEDGVGWGEDGVGWGEAAGADVVGGGVAAEAGEDAAAVAAVSLLGDGATDFVAAWCAERGLWRAAARVHEQASRMHATS